jgi:hypothetical protein
MDRDMTECDSSLSEPNELAELARTRLAGGDWGDMSLKVVLDRLASSVAEMLGSVDACVGG